MSDLQHVVGGGCCCGWWLCCCCGLHPLLEGDIRLKLHLSPLPVPRLLVISCPPAPPVWLPSDPDSSLCDHRRPDKPGDGDNIKIMLVLL